MVERKIERPAVSWLIAGCIGACASTALAEDPSGDQPSSETEDDGAGSGAYVAALATTTLAYLPPGEAFDGPQSDITPALGVGYFVTEMVALELDAGATFNEEGYVATALTPGLIWAFHANVYVAARFIVPIHPEPNFVLYPGIGFTHLFDVGIAPFVELNAASAVGRGEPDFGVTATVGLTYAI